MDVDGILELLDIYQDMVEKQDEIIYRLGKIVARQEADTQLLNNDKTYTELSQEKAIINEVQADYRKLKTELEP